MSAPLRDTNHYSHPPLVLPVTFSQIPVAHCGPFIPICHGSMVENDYFTALFLSIRVLRSLAEFNCGSPYPGKRKVLFQAIMILTPKRHHCLYDPVIPFTFTNTNYIFQSRSKVWLKLLSSLCYSYSVSVTGSCLTGEDSMRLLREALQPASMTSVSPAVASCWPHMFQSPPVNAQSTTRQLTSWCS